MADDIYMIHDRLDHARNLAEGDDPALSVGLVRQVAMQVGEPDLHIAADLLANRPDEVGLMIAMAIIDETLAVLRRRMIEVGHAADGNQLWRHRKVFELAEGCRRSRWREGKAAHAYAVARLFGLYEVAGALRLALQAEEARDHDDYLDNVRAAQEAALRLWSQASTAA